MKTQLITGNLSVSNLLLRAVTTLLLLLMGLDAQSQEMPLSAISHQKGPPSAMNLSELKSVFKGEKQRWPDGTKISIALMKTNNPVGQTICKKIYDMSGDELNKFWLALVFQGKVSAPNFFNSVDELENFVAQNPGAIGIVNEQAHTSDIKTLTINGKRTF
jgi:hypothetical protein